MNIQDKLTAVNARAAKLYLQLQNIETRIQQCQLDRSQIMQEMMKTDGEIELLNILLQEQSNA